MDARARRGAFLRLAWIAALAVGLAGPRVAIGSKIDPHGGARTGLAATVAAPDAFEPAPAETRFAAAVPGLTRGGLRHAPPAAARRASYLHDASAPGRSRRHLERVRARPPPAPHG